MKQLLLRVGADRSALGILAIGSGGWSVAASAKSDPASGLPDPAVGRYRLVRATDIPEAFVEARRAYGHKMLFFQVDQTVIPLHAGDLAGSGKLLPTDGGIRLSGEDFAKLIEQIGDDTDVRLEIRETAELEGVLQAAGEKVRVSRQSAPRPTRRASSPPPALSSSTPVHHHHHSSSGDDVWFWYWMFSDSGNHQHHHDYPPADTRQDIPAEVRTDGYGEDPPAGKADGLAPGTLPVISPDFLPPEEPRPLDGSASGGQAETPPEGEAADASTAEAPDEDAASEAGSADDSSGTGY